MSSTLHLLGVSVLLRSAHQAEPAGFYVAANRGKRGIAVDLRHPEAAEVRRRLLAWADVVHHNVRLEPAARLGIDEAATRAANPDAVFGHTSAYGLRGTRADWPGYDSVIQSLAGWSRAMAGKGNPPLFNHLGTFDTLPAAGAAIGLLLALFHRRRTGVAKSSWTALLNSARRMSTRPQRPSAMRPSR